MQLGAFESDLPVILAPMAGVTDLPMRQLAVKHGADIAVGEMMSSDLSLAHSRKSQSRAVHSSDAGLRSVQLVGNDPETIAKPPNLMSSAALKLSTSTWVVRLKKCVRRPRAQHYSQIPN